jgi:MerR family transcriptional regulator, copper efflux regulator
MVLAKASAKNVSNATKGTCSPAHCRRIACRFRDCLKKSLDLGTGSKVHTFPMTEKPKAFRSGELARAVGISTDALRHYEKLGVLPRAPRTASGYRLYPPDSLERVKTVRHAMQLGFTLHELAEILRIRDRGGAPCKRVLLMLQEKLEALQERIAELQQTQNYMESMVKDWRSRIAQGQSGEKAFLLRSLNGQTPANAIREPLRREKRK